MTETLKPCPFCGDKAVLKEALRWHGAFRVECSNCDATVWATGEDNPASAIAAWNRRAAPREPGGDMVRLTDVMARIAEASLRYGGTQESWLVGPRQLTEDIRALAARPDAGEPGKRAKFHPDCTAARCGDPDLAASCRPGMPCYSSPRAHSAPRPDAGDGTGEPTS